MAWFAALSMFAGITERLCLQKGRGVLWEVEEAQGRWTMERGGECTHQGSTFPLVKRMRDPAFDDDPYQSFVQLTGEVEEAKQTSHKCAAKTPTHHHTQ